jgi:hypothetical protein
MRRNDYILCAMAYGLRVVGRKGGHEATSLDIFGAAHIARSRYAGFRLGAGRRPDDRATARSRHLLVMRGPKGEPTPALAGRYEDELIREDGQWRILRRVDYPIMPTAEEWMKFIRERKAAGQ